MFPGVSEPTSTDRLGAELADEQLKLILGLRQVRTDRGLSLAEVAETMKVDVSQVSRFETGSTNPTMSTIRRYAKAVGGVFRVETASWHAEKCRMISRNADVVSWDHADADHEGYDLRVWSPSIMAMR
ncbi:transcriptional regulator [Gordonia phage Agueybana]|uniref:Helix-turn-helix DNA binding domain protein n=1 Tax=Gordonia phage Agueybana TaxID=2859634 RepID=A0AC61NLR9_9CAUD|nr:transcriptional regulator [Gordonia phage Agueybana]QYC54600.1 helix-turn-helix DNA binding domain protein [Gordonia phage Agueybana]